MTAARELFYETVTEIKNRGLGDLGTAKILAKRFGLDLDEAYFMITGNELFGSVPSELKELGQWVVWKSIRKPYGLAKVPFSAFGGCAKTTDPETWSSFDEAVRAYAKGDYDGIGFVFAPDGGYVGIDIDDCLSEDGGISSEAAKIVYDMKSYTEISPSGLGLHIIIKGKKSTEKCKNNIVEIYEKSRYFCFTGNAYNSVSVIEPRQTALDALCASL